MTSAPTPLTILWSKQKRTIIVIGSLFLCFVFIVFMLRQHAQDESASESQSQPTTTTTSKEVDPHYNEYYAKYYNLFYKDKNYKKEVDYIHKLIQNHIEGDTKQTILELGCGTGKHAHLLNTEYQYNVLAVDRSENMIAMAKQDYSSNSNLDFRVGDVRTFQADQSSSGSTSSGSSTSSSGTSSSGASSSGTTASSSGTTASPSSFDIVLSLFHVVSYQTKNEDLLAEFKTVSNHLRSGGVFIFDIWYGPAVLTDRPSDREKRVMDGHFHIVRKATPEMFPNENRVNVEYLIHVEDQKKRTKQEFREVHPMRYLFLPELVYMLSKNDLEFVHAEEWITGNEPSFETWSVTVVARKK